MEQIVVLDNSAIPAQYPLLRPNFAHTWTSYELTSYEDIVSCAREASMILTSKCKLDASVIAQLPNLRYIGCLATGYNNIDIKAAAARGIAVTNAQGYSTEAVAEHSITMLLYLARRLGTTEQAMQQGAWMKSPTFWMLPGGILMDLKGKVLTIIGAGAIGSRTAQLAAAFGMQIVKAEHKDATTIRPGYTAFNEALEMADAIIVCCPLTAQTINLIAAPELARLKPTCILINNSRGGLINENDMVTALLDGKLGGVGTDVASTEPLPATHPFSKVLHCPNFILTPHQAWASQGALEELLLQVKDNMEAFVRGERLRRVES
ncbi:MAG: glycerate dehydrogenase [Candidatus Anaerobiospirillum merdipullorum]|uniref:Glycerate dehydrogenase n=1 Tax=Candidatus Anaerobiospirillum merdipullorum TaxID=2838450 RepID=A0A9E2KPT6_9GAMM|nr:glycerate dehydrogenase [Candidatus Anaerobiospirillum merdipullorum]